MKTLFKNICIASDHAGYNLKEYLKNKLSDDKIIISDLGTYGNNSVDYPDFAPQVYYDNGAVPTDPVDVFADITAPAGYVAPSFNIVPLIRVK